MDGKRKAPAVRFAGFTGDWEQRKFDEVFISFANKDYQVQSTEYCEVGEYPIIDQGKKAIIGYSDNHVKVCNRFPCIIFGDHTTELKYIDFPFIVGADGVKTLSVKNGDTLFQYYNLQVNKVQPTGYNRHFSILKEITLNMTTLAEQQLIGKFFFNLDHLITLHQRKYDALVNTKKSMLQKMFPQNGETVPEIRFAGFTGDWEQRKLKEVVNVFDGVHQTPEYKERGIMFLSVENIVSLKSDKYISEEAFLKDYKVYPQKGDVLMTRIGDVGTPNVVETDEKVAFYVSLALLKPIEIDSYFLCGAIQSPFFKRGLKERTLVTAIPQKINKDEIGKVDIMMPNSFTEQDRIGIFFHNIDTSIALQHQKLEKLKQLKQSMLEKMFV